MEKIGLFYGTDTGNTENIALKIREKISKEMVYLIDMYDVKAKDFAQYDKIILGLSTWHDGQLQSDWDTFFEEFKGGNFFVSDHFAQINFVIGFEGRFSGEGGV